VVYSIKLYSIFEAIISLCRTFFVCIVLGIGSVYFSQDANNLVLSPIERMLEKVKFIAKNPLAAATDDIESAGVHSHIHNVEQQKTKKKKDESKDAEYETQILEKAIVKIGHLLAIGFGEAGSKIIADNMTDGGDLNPMMPGVKSHGIFGFCNIRNFMDITEVLQVKVMLFVNQIAEVAHSQVDKYGGSTNKNIGDSFLMVWKFKYPEDFEENDDGTIGDGTIAEENQIQADMALFSFIKILAKINKLTPILNYRKDPALQERIPNYTVQMGFGLHQGWAIEGAIGSFFKIDASYLSPNVNMASRLEYATKQYGVPILVSGPFQQICSTPIKRFLREIDRVTVKGSTLPIQLFTVDVQYDNLEEVPDRYAQMLVKEKKSMRDEEKKKILG
jgi:class 3 adenylate cyclase